ncbi:CHAP domain-containing protein [Cellulomonas alba]|uniref:CHAP domain-containing protein n=1 Tax=Cellulomonas alba TaxID=3053467 RepID=A0ABT7SCX7_9CELL|nr:CHAP domain-containing protein [Cellulomonas alba]MDM7854046.1 CHAP domain-containing protein [Cellulomonas alba]
MPSLVLSAAIALVVALVTCGPAAPAQAAARTAVTFSASQTALRKGEMTWLSGRVTVGSSGASQAKVAVERRAGAGAWSRLTTLTTTTTGRFAVRQRPAAAYSYRARVLAAGSVGSAVSRTATIRFSGADRTLAQRATVLRPQLGPLTGATTAASGSVRYRSTTKGLLVEVRTSSSVRTWLVYGDILTAYRKAGGPKGKLGAPLADPKCGLLESGCVQRFARGAIYDNAHTKGTVAYGTGRVTEIIAAERSQLGYGIHTLNRSKYNAWAHSPYAWCSLFQSWAAAATGNAAYIPQSTKFSRFVAATKAHLRTGSTPRVGALVFFDTDADGRTAPTHVGLVIAVHATTITTIEANTSNPAGGTARGVYLKERVRSWPLFYAYPKYLS